MDAADWQTVVGEENTSELNGVTGMTADRAQEKERGVGLVAVTIPGHGPIPIGTAWVCRPGVLATNAHVALGIAEMIKKAEQKGIKGSVPYYLPSRAKGKAVRIINYAIHPDFKRIAVSADGVLPVSTPDVALMKLKEKLAPLLTMAGKSELEYLRPGETVQYVGFPMENLAGHNVNLHDVMATTQTGTITSVSDWWLGDSGAAANKLIRHDMGIAGGASGSPIFNKNGRVIGLINAGNMVPNFSLTESGKLNIARTPSAARVNFGVRVDLLNDISI